MALIPSSLSAFNPQTSCFCVGCEDGTVVTLAIRSNLVSIDGVSRAHSSLVTAIAVESILHDVFLVASTAMDWCTRVWNGEVGEERGVKGS